MEDYEEKVYQKLKNGKFIVKLSDHKKQDYEYKHLVPHAKGAGKKRSSLKKFREKSKHLALARYLEKDCAPVKVDPMEVEVEEGKIVDVVGSSDVVVVEGNLCSHGKGCCEFLICQVHSLWGAGSTGKAIVEFTSDWSGFRSAMSFENEFNSTGHGKVHFSLDRCGVGGMYGWVAREDDYKSDGVVGNFLSRNGDLKTIKDIEDVDLRKNKQLVTNLVHLVDEKNKNLEQTLKMQQDQKDRLEKMSNEREELKSKMESQKE
ncbi:hypothetical protein MKW92_016718 [Papaver armeniacum]|nr:hypothetical protein MKW92_016718 [Papaver armeniacum]